VLFRQTDSTVNPSITNIQNIERMRARGVEASYSAIGLFEGRFDLLTSVAFNRSKTLENSRSPASVGKEFPRIPRLRAALVATYHFTPDWSATLAGRYAGRQFNSPENIDVNPNTFGGTSAIKQLDLKVNWKLDKHWTASLGVDNLTNDKAYVFHSYPQRSYLGELKWNY
jgi:iron complex outermembrane recepter protein